MARLEQFWQQPIEQLKLPRSPDNLLVDVRTNTEVLVNLAEDKRVVANLPELHDSIL